MLSPGNMEFPIYRIPIPFLFSQLRSQNQLTILLGNNDHVFYYNGDYETSNKK